MRYSKQHPDLPTVECETCGGEGFIVGIEMQLAANADPDDVACPTCDGSGRVSPYSPFSGIGDEVEWHRAPGAGTGIIVGVFASDDFPLILEPSQAGQGGRASVEAVALIRPCLDTPERQALQEKLEQ